MATTTIKKIYSDIDLSFNRNPVTGDVTISYDEQAVLRSVRNLLLTNRYERLFQPNVGSNLTGLLFENTGPEMESVIATEIVSLGNPMTRFVVEFTSWLQEKV